MRKKSVRNGFRAQNLSLGNRLERRTGRQGTAPEDLYPYASYKTIAFRSTRISGEGGAQVSQMLSRLDASEGEKSWADIARKDRGSNVEVAG